MKYIQIYEKKRTKNNQRAFLKVRQKGREKKLGSQAKETRRTKTKEMKEIIIKTQKELDKIPLDYDGYVYIEGGTEENPLTFQTNFEKATIIVRGKAYLYVRGSAVINYVGGSAVINYVGGSAVIKDVRGSAVINDVRGSAVINYVRVS